MFKKCFNFMILFCLLTLQVQAASGNGLKEAYDELTYSLDVEWDQNDKDFYDEQMKKFSATLTHLQADGLVTNEQVLNLIKTEVKDQKLSKDLEAAFNLITVNKMTSSQARVYISDILNKSYSTGASWNGEIAGYILSGLIIAGIITVFIGLLNESSWMTHDFDVCTGGGVVQVCVTGKPCEMRDLCTGDVVY